MVAGLFYDATPGFFDEFDEVEDLLRLWHIAHYRIQGLTRIQFRLQEKAKRVFDRSDLFSIKALSSQPERVHPITTGPISDSLREWEYIFRDDGISSDKSEFPDAAKLMDS